MSRPGANSTANAFGMVIEAPAPMKLEPAAPSLRTPARRGDPRRSMGVTGIDRQHREGGGVGYGEAQAKIRQLGRHAHRSLTKRSRYRRSASHDEPYDRARGHVSTTSCANKSTVSDG